MMRTKQPSLFSDEELAATVRCDSYYDEPLRRGRQTKRHEAEKDAGKRNRNDVFDSIKPRREGDAAKIVARLQVLGSRGATRDELYVQLNMPLATVCGRVRELLSAMPPSIEETTERRLTRTGSTAVVLRIKRDN